MQLRQQTILGSGPFDDIGRPHGIYWNADRTLIAIAGAFSGEQWHGRFLDRSDSGWRVSLYEAATLRTIARLDGIKMPINDLAFHPHLPLLTIGGGRYDGGYIYGGGLILWDFATDRHVSLLTESREVVRCSFGDDDGIEITLRPAVDEDFYDEERGINLRPWQGGGSAPKPRRLWLDTTIPAAGWQAFQARSIAVDSLSITYSPAEEGRTRYRKQKGEEVERELDALAHAVVGLHYIPRWDIWDVAWIPDDRILTTRNGTTLEAWRPDGTHLAHLSDEADGVQLLASPDGAVAYANLADKGGFRQLNKYKWENATHIERIDLRTWERAAIPGSDGPITLSIASSGHLLARDTIREWHRRDGPTHDRLIAPDLTISPPLDLGGYDAVNHYLRIDGTPFLYFLQGTPARADFSQRPRVHSSRDKWLCRLNPQTRHHERLFPLEWDSAQERHLYEGCGLAVVDTLGSAVILALTIHHPEYRHPTQSVIARRHLPTGRVQWHLGLNGAVVALAQPARHNIVLFVLTDGTLGVLDASSGQLLHQERLVLDGIPVRPLSLAVHDTQIAVGLVDGRVLLYEWRR